LEEFQTAFGNALVTVTDMSEDPVLRRPVRVNTSSMETNNYVLREERADETDEGQGLTLSPMRRERGPMTAAPPPPPGIKPFPNSPIANSPNPVLEENGSKTEELIANSLEVETNRTTMEMINSFRGELRAAFNQMDKNGDGSVSYKEWMRGLAMHEVLLSKAFGGANLQEVGVAFRSLDMNKDMSLTWEEFENGILQGSKTAPEDGRIPADATAGIPADATAGIPVINMTQSLQDSKATPPPLVAVGDLAAEEVNRVELNSNHNPNPNPNPDWRST